MRYLTVTILFVFHAVGFAQIRGMVTDTAGVALAYVTVQVQQSTIGTSTNGSGQFELRMQAQEGSCQLTFQSLGYRSKTMTVDLSRHPVDLKIVLHAEQRMIDEVVVGVKGIDPAVYIIQQAIRSRKANGERNDKYRADFYSRGIFRVKELPKRILGQKIEDEDGILDTSRSGVIYLSETVSEIAFQKPNSIREKIVASKVSGDDKGFSFNTAQGTNFDFYTNTVDLGAPIISPISDRAFSYYRFKRESKISLDDGPLVHRLSVTPIRKKEPTVAGYIYIVDQTWAIYAVDFKINGYSMNQPIIDTLSLRQQYIHNSQDNRWSKSLQTIDFQASILGFHFNGRYIHNFSNYAYVRDFGKGVFSNVVATMVKDANTKDEAYWKAIRPIPLTLEERQDYIRKDSIQTLRSSPSYIDSLDRKYSKFSFLDVITGYQYRHTPSNFLFEYRGLSNIFSTSFNTVQGWNFNAMMSAKLGRSGRGRYSTGKINFNYGLADRRLRVEGLLTHRFDTHDYRVVSVEGGRKISQFNTEEPISKLVNMGASLFFKENFMKVYQQDFVKLAYAQQVTTAVRMMASVAYSDRIALENQTNFSFFNKEKNYTANNPLQPQGHDIPIFDRHHLFKYALGTQIKFGQQVFERPDARIAVPNDRYPIVSMQWEQAFGASASKYKYQALHIRADQDVVFGNKGQLGVVVKAGKFFNAEQISFADFQHFNGNQTHVGTTTRYLNNFLLLPYYTNSTDDAYLEMHAEHNFKGYLLNRVPLLNQLQWNIVLGYHHLSVPDRQPYHEFTFGLDNIGWGKFRMLRLDYVRSLQSGRSKEGVIIGLKFLGILN